MIGSIIERKTKSPASFRPQSTSDPQTGFPTVNHRSTSAFGKSREALRLKRSSTKDAGVPIVSTVNEPPEQRSAPLEAQLAQVANWREQLSRENEERLNKMSVEDIERERLEVLERMPDLEAMLSRIRERRERTHLGPDLSSVTLNPVVPLQVDTSQHNLEMHSPRAILPHEPSHGLPERPPSQLKSALSRTSTPKPGQKLRFSSGPDEVHVYESQPSSPRRPIALLPPPDPTNPSENTIDMSQYFKSKPILQGAKDVGREEEEGTPEDIRNRYFPSASPHNPSLQWINPLPHHPPSDDDPSLRTPRYDLQGFAILPEAQSSLPTHLGLHHHDGDLAGYTVDDLLLLARSTVPAQRASILGVLSKILSRLCHTHTPVGMDSAQASELRSKAFVAGVEAMGERGSVGARAIDLVWTALVRWDADQEMEEPVALEGDGSGILSLVPLPSLLSLIINHLDPKSRTLPYSTLCQTLEVLLRISRESPDAALEVLKAPHLIQAVLQTFVSPALPSYTEETTPNPLAIRLFTSLAQASRSAAKAIIDSSIPDTFLRFVAILPNASSLPQSLHYSLTSETLRLYRVLGQYGFHSHTATTAAESFTKLTAYLIDEVRSDDALTPELVGLTKAWVSLMSVWITCAINPHNTTPTHDILWSQIVGWNWLSDLLMLRESFVQRGHPPTAVLIAIWSALSAWSEGVAINSAHAGRAENGMLLESLQASIGMEVEQFISACNELKAVVMVQQQQEIIKVSFFRNLAQPCECLHALVRLVITCCGSLHSASTSENPLSLHSTLPIPTVLPLCVAITKHPIWDQVHSSDLIVASPSYVLLRPVTSLLQAILIATHRSIHFSSEDWLAQAIRTIPCLLPGDAELAVEIIHTMKNIICKDLVCHEWGWSVLEEFWSKGGLEVLVPFLVNAIHPQSQSELEASEEDLDPQSRIAPFITSPQSIAQSTTQTLPSACSLQSSTRKGLPLRQTAWIFSPLSELLRSGNSSVFKTLPQDWDGSETDIVRATMLLAKIALRVASDPARQNDDPTVYIRREAIAFGCMKVFMLEHGQGNGSISLEDSSNEVFRDPMVASVMEDILTYIKISSSDAPAPTSGPALEKAAVAFLGASTPFFQFYSDFLGLYDSISFGHPIFGALLIPPLSMQYPTDYRKLLWGDYNHVLRSLDIEPEDVIGNDLGDWLYPVESDGEMLGYYLKALGVGKAKGFLQWIAIHHLGCVIWPDLSPSSHPEDLPQLDEERLKVNLRRRILMALLDTAHPDAARSVVLYHQTQAKLLLPPECFSLGGDQKRQRWKFVSGLEDKQLSLRLQALLSP